MVGNVSKWISYVGGGRSVSLPARRMTFVKMTGSVTPKPQLLLWLRG